MVGEVPFMPPLLEEESNLASEESSGQDVKESQGTPGRERKWRVGSRLEARYWTILKKIRTILVVAIFTLWVVNFQLLT